MTDNSTVRWGILSTASIGQVMSQAIKEAPNAELVAVAGRNKQRAQTYATQLGIPYSYGSYEELLSSEDVDAIYVPLPISLHSTWTAKALEAGKHVLCEKPLAPSTSEVTTVFDAAESAGRQVIEGLMWRHHPRTRYAQQLIADGQIGDLLHIRTALSVSAPAGDIRRTGALGGGASLDLGCYCVSAIRYFGGEPLSVSAFSITDNAAGADGADLRTAGTMLLAGDRMAQFDVALDFPRRDQLELIGTKGTLSIPDPWLCRVSHLTFIGEGAKAQTLATPDPESSASKTFDNVDSYRAEIEHASNQILGKVSADFGRADALGQAAALEAIRTSAQTASPVSPKQFVSTSTTR